MHVDLEHSTPSNAKHRDLLWHRMNMLVSMSILNPSRAERLGQRHGAVQERHSRRTGS